MKTRVSLMVIFVMVAAVTGFIISHSKSTAKVETKSTTKIPEQFIVLLDLSDRIIQQGQIEADKELIKKTFEEFERKAYSHLLIKSKDKFFVCIAPQKNLPFDKDAESEKLTIDLSKIKTAERAKKLKEFKESLDDKLNQLYGKAYVGSNSKQYEGSNIWQFFNETLPAMTNAEIITRLVVITDGYFDFEENNAKLTKGNLSTTTQFFKEIRKSTDWKKDIDEKGYGILPINKKIENALICVSEIRSKNENNLYETEMLQYVWTKWLSGSGIADSCSHTILHGSFTTTKNQLSAFLTREI